MFLFHYGQRQLRGSRRRGLSTLPLNVLKRGPITYYSINFSQPKNCSDFFNNSAVDVFLDSVYETFRPGNKFQEQISRLCWNCESARGEVILEGKRIWLTNSYNSKDFNDFIRGEIRDETTKRIIANSQTGSSWYFKRFQRLTVIVVSLADSVKLLSS